MRRRAFLAGIAASASAPAAAQITRSKQVGILFPGEFGSERLRLVKEGLLKATKVPFSVIVREARGDQSQLQSLARAFVEEKVDVILAAASASLRAAFEATRYLPIVALDLESDPVAAGMVASLSHPGGNVTGIFFDAPEIAGKWLQLLKDVVPHLASVGLLYDQHTDDAQVRAAERAASTLGLRSVRLPVNTPNDLVSVIGDGASKLKPDALLIHSSPVFVDQAKTISAAALRHKLPAIGLFPVNARTGALMAFGPDPLALWLHVGEIVGKVCAGVRPADLPIERPTRFKLIVNTSTARELGIPLSSSFLLIADEVAE